MKCPYREFEDCLIQECPSCDYEVEEIEHIEHYYKNPANYRLYRESEYKRIEKKYIFKSCSLVKNNVQPIPKAETHIDARTSSKTLVHSSIF